MNISPFAYNESAANEYYPLNHDHINQMGLKWTDQLPYTKGQETVQSSNIPDTIQDVYKDFLENTFACTDCQRNFKVILSEFEIYQKMPVPLPRRCPQCRQHLRFQKKTPTHIWNRTCSNCSKEIQTTYSPKRPEIVYCEECYLAEVY